MSEINFKYGALIRGGPKQSTGGKWDATFDEYVRNRHTNADLHHLHPSILFEDRPSALDRSLR